MQRDVEICLTTSDGSLRTFGAVYTAKYPPVRKAARVQLMLGKSALLALDPGVYFYLFSVVASEGKFSLAIKGMEDVSSQGFDTTVSGARGLTYSFVVM